MWTVLAMVSLVLTGLVAGILFGVALANVPAFAALSLRQYAGIHQILDRYYEPTMPLLVLLSVLADLGLVLASDCTGCRVLFGIAAIALLGVAGVSQLANVPLLKPLRTLDVDQMPADWPDPRPAWRRWHLVRTCLGCLALVAAAGGVSF